MTHEVDMSDRDRPRGPPPTNSLPAPKKTGLSSPDTFGEAERLISLGYIAF